MIQQNTAIWSLTLTCGVNQKFMIYEISITNVPTACCFYNGNTKSFCQRRVQKYVTSNEHL